MSNDELVCTLNRFVEPGPKPQTLLNVAAHWGLVAARETNPLACSTKQKYLFRNSTGCVSQQHYSQYTGCTPV